MIAADAEAEADEVAVTGAAQALRDGLAEDFVRVRQRELRVELCTCAEDLAAPVRGQLRQRPISVRPVTAALEEEIITVIGDYGEQPQLWSECGYDYKAIESAVKKLLSLEPSSKKESAAFLN